MTNVKEAKRPKGGRAGPLCGRVNVRVDFRWERWCSASLLTLCPSRKASSSVTPHLYLSHWRHTKLLQWLWDWGHLRAAGRGQTPFVTAQRVLDLFVFIAFASGRLQTRHLLCYLRSVRKQKKNHVQDSCRLFEGPVWVAFNTNYKLTHRVNRSIQLTVEREHYATLTASVQHQLYCFM